MEAFAWEELVDLGPWSCNHLLQHSAQYWVFYLACFSYCLRWWHNMGLLTWNQFRSSLSSNVCFTLNNQLFPGGVLPIMSYTLRFDQKGVRTFIRVRISPVEVYKGQPNLLFPSVKRPKRANRKEKISWFCDFFIFSQQLKGMQCSRPRHVKGIAFVNRRYMKGVPFLSKEVYKRRRGEASAGWGGGSLPV